jgi:agmatinase
MGTPTATQATFLAIPDREAGVASYAILQVPYEGSVSYGQGTALAPSAIVNASTQVELYDPEVGLDLERLNLHNPAPVEPLDNEDVADYLDRLDSIAKDLHDQGMLVMGIGGDHSVTPALVRAARASRCTEDDTITVLHIDAHADLRDTYDGSKHSHACAIRRVLEDGVDNVLSIGIRSGEKAEFEMSENDERIFTVTAQDLHKYPSAVEVALDKIRTISGKLYITFDIDALEVHLCPATGTPEPGGLGWWDALRFVRAAFMETPKAQVIGADVVETVPMEGSGVNEFVAAKLVTKFLAYHKARRLQLDAL